MKAYAVLRPAAAKRLIAKGVKARPSVKRALKEGTIVVTLGTTNGYVAEELLGGPIDRGAFAAGLIEDRWNINARLGEEGEVIMVKGKRVKLDTDELLDSLTAGDVIIKGGNALDPFGTVGVLMGAENGGTVGRYVPLALARGVEIVIPISVGKSIHTPISELAMKESMFDVRATHIASGGIGEGLGSVSLLIEGEKEDVSAAYGLICSLAGEREPPLEGRR